MVNSPFIELSAPYRNPHLSLDTERIQIYHSKKVLISFTEAFSIHRLPTGYQYPDSISGQRCGHFHLQG